MPIFLIYVGLPAALRLKIISCITAALTGQLNQQCQMNQQCQSTKGNA